MAESVSPADLWIKLTEMPRPSKVVDFPRFDANGNSLGKIAICVLSQEEQMICSASAEKMTREILKEIPKESDAKQGYTDIYSNAAAVEILYRACRRAEDVKQPFFPSPKQMRQTLSIDEVGVLFSHYLTVQSELGPIISFLGEGDMDAWVKRLQEGGSRFPLDLLASEPLKILAYSLALRLYPYLMGTSSVGSQPDEASLNP